MPKLVGAEEGLIRAPGKGAGEGYPFSGGGGEIDWVGARRVHGNGQRERLLGRLAARSGGPVKKTPNR